MVLDFLGVTFALKEVWGTSKGKDLVLSSLKWHLESAGKGVLLCGLLVSCFGHSVVFVCFRALFREERPETLWLEVSHASLLCLTDTGGICCKYSEMTLQVSRYMYIYPGL